MTDKDSKTGSILDQNWFTCITRPSRYLGAEINAIKKDPSKIDVSMVLAFPDVYEVGMCHLGLKLLYHILNSREWMSVERAFCPWVDLEKELLARNLPLTTMESHRPLSDFDLVGFSLQHELTFTNLLSMLALSGIPFLSNDRDRIYPLIIAGGPACFNPEPVADLFDAIVIGDGEEAALEICKTIREAKSQKVKGKKEILQRLATIRGVYVPQFFKVHYAAEGNIETIEALLPDYERVEKAIIPDIDQYPFPARQVVPFTELVHDRLVVEISRGCTRGCRFCQAGMIYRPVRERNPETILKDSEKGLALTGFGELSLLSLSSGDYSCIGSLLMALMDRQSRDKIAISLPSLRIDSLDPVWFEQIKRVRKTGFTLAPEVGSDRLRATINKAMTNRDILKMAREVYNAGWNLIKLYFMIGLPGEEDHDLQEIISLAKDVIRSTKGGKKKIKLNVSLSTFVPKSHTPFMWAPQITLEKSRRSIRTIQNALKDRHIRVKWNQPETSWLEGIFSRGDRRLTSALIDAWQMGARFDAWTEHYNMEIWKEALKRTGLEPDFYLYRTRSMDEIFPWDHIESGVSKGYLKNEWERAMAGKATPDCREHCLECGVCDHKEIDPKLWKNWTPPPKCGTPSREENPALLKRYRLTFSKTGSARYLSHLEMVRLFIRAFRRAGLHIAHSKGFHPMPKISFAAALPVGMESIHETVNLQIYETTPFSSLKEKINQQLPKGIRITQIEGVTRSGKGPKVKESHYHINMDGVKVEQEALEKFLKSTDFSIIKKTKKGEKMIDARRLVKSIGLVPPHDLDMVINHTDGPALRPLDIVKEIFHLDDHQVEAIKILKVRQVMD